MTVPVARPAEAGRFTVTGPAALRFVSTVLSVAVTVTGVVVAVRTPWARVGADGTPVNVGEASGAYPGTTGVPVNVGEASGAYPGTTGAPVNVGEASGAMPAAASDAAPVPPCATGNGAARCVATTSGAAAEPLRSAASWTPPFEEVVASGVIESAIAHPCCVGGEGFVVLAYARPGARGAGLDTGSPVEGMLLRGFREPPALREGTEEAPEAGGLRG